MTWTKGNRTLTYDGRHRVTKVDDVYRMVIDRAMANDAGKYTVTVETDKKRLQASTRVEIVSPRAATRVPRQQSTESDRSSIGELVSFVQMRQLIRYFRLSAIMFRF